MHRISIPLGHIKVGLGLRILPYQEMRSSRSLCWVYHLCGIIFPGFRLIECFFVLLNHSQWLSHMPLDISVFQTPGTVWGGEGKGPSVASPEGWVLVGPFSLVS